MSRLQQLIIISSLEQKAAIYHALTPIVRQFQMLDIALTENLILDPYLATSHTFIILNLAQSSAEMTHNVLATLQNQAIQAKLILLFSHFDFQQVNDLPTTVADVLAWQELPRLAWTILRERRAWESSDTTQANFESQSHAKHANKDEQNHVLQEQMLYRLHTFHSIDQAILRADSLENLANNALAAISKLIPYYRASIISIEASIAKAHIIAIQMPYKQSIVQAGQDYQMRQAEIATFQEQDYMLLRNLDDYPTKAAQALAQEGVRTSLSVGLKQQGHLLGALTLHAQDEDFFTEDVIAIAKEIADQLAIGIHTHQLNEQIRQHAKELENRVLQRTQELELEKQRIEAVINSSSDGILIIDTYFQIQAANNAFCQIFDCSNIDYMQRSFFQIVLPEHRSRLFNLVGKVLKGQVVQRLQVQAQTYQQNIIFVEIAIAKYSASLEDEPQLVCTIRDITERKAAEFALKQYASEVHDLYNNAPVGYYSLDAQGMIIQMNQTALKWLGYSYQDVIRKFHITDLMTAESQEIFYQNFDRYKARGYLPATEFVFKGHDNRLFPVLVSATAIYNDKGEFLQSRSSLIDISERKEAEQALAQREELYRTTIAAMSEGIVVQGLDGIIQICNQAAENILGLSPEQMMGRGSVDSDWQTIHEDGSPFFGKDHPAMVTLRTGQPQSKVIMGVYRPDNDLIWISVNSQAIKLAGQTQAELVVTTFLDVSATKRFKETLELALMQEKELNELKSRFVSMATHEFRTPLAAILSTTETLMLYRERMDEEQISARLDKIRRQVDFLRTVMDDVLQLIRLQAKRLDYHPVQTDLDAIFQDVNDELQSRAEYRGRLVYETTSSPLMAFIDQRLMRHVTSNLIANALKYSADDSLVHIRLWRDATHIYFEVRDEGIGIPDDDIKHLFDPFHRAANVGGISGTGLGLSIAKEAIELHNGTIQLVSEINVGTTFTVTFPQMTP